MFKKFDTIPDPLTSGITVYGMDYCPYSRSAVQLAKSCTKDTLFVEAKKGDEKYKKVSKESPTIPVVYIDGKHVGGYTEFSKVELTCDILEKKKKD